MPLVLAEAWGMLQGSRAGQMISCIISYCEIDFLRQLFQHEPLAQDEKYTWIRLLTGTGIKYVLC
jgi:hypothetical protein